MTRRYYRIVAQDRGRETVFVPEKSYERVTRKQGLWQEDDEEMAPVKEVCFAKSLEGCLLAISMFLTEQAYYVYETAQRPCLDLSESGIGDFSATQEVRYRLPVEATCLGKLPVSSYLIHCLRGVYENCNYTDIFDYRRALEQLRHFQKVRDLVG